MPKIKKSPKVLAVFIFSGIDGQAFPDSAPKKLKRCSQKCPKVAKMLLQVQNVAQKSLKNNRLRFAGDVVPLTDFFACLASANTGVDNSFSLFPFCSDTFNSIQIFLRIHVS